VYQAFALWYVKDAKKEADFEGLRPWFSHIYLSQVSNILLSPAISSA